MADFKINSQKLQNGIVAITVKGFLDAYTYGELEQTIQDFFNQNLYRFIVDLAQVDYISSAGAGVFIGAIGLAQENKGNIVIIRPKPNVKEVFDLLGLSQIFTIAGTMEAALKVFR
ncbi:MAG: STAS domain-containing protein [Planctomycetes bacterium]|nr:STAS domain-containing protein [Planctomycetota bacterium]MCK5578550.1 STAS domain-containing protein [Planctomycetota bacterium]